MSSKKQFSEPVFRQLDIDDDRHSNNIIKAGKTQIRGSKKVSVFEENVEGIKVILEKDKQDNIKEIKFQCSCGQTKSIVLDYSD
ncbi:MAG: hypothetical protein SCALA702_26670 [Melioribacteraceae bacterium]|nr:MAG: hypothetical protein SCALA702_26670 [Melioribacteraceae bacterium]